MKRLLLAALLLSAPANAAPAAWSYTVEAAPSLDTLAVDARLAEQSDRDLTLAGDAEKYVDHLEIETPSGWRGFDGSTVPGDLHGVWHLRYRFRLAQAGRELRSPRRVAAYGEAIASGPDSWLIRPDTAPPAGRFACQLRGVPFVSGLNESSDHSFGGSCSQLADAPGCILGKFASVTLAPGFVLAYLPGQLAIGDADLTDWVRRTADGVADYFGRFPVQHGLLLVLPGGKREVSGYTYGDGGATVTLTVPKTAPADNVKDAWTLCHELVHLAIPNLNRRHHWFEEGVATYVEPLIRLKLGMIDAHRVWDDLIDGLPNGLGSTGLDSSHSWGATYWGGALFCLLADVDIRVATHNAHSFGDALRAVVAAGGNVSQSWTLERVLSTGDRAIGGELLQQRYRHQGLQALKIDLPALWARLGISRKGKSLALGEAPLAYVRKGIAGL